MRKGKAILMLLSIFFSSVFLFHMKKEPYINHNLVFLKPYSVSHNRVIMSFAFT